MYGQQEGEVLPAVCRLLELARLPLLDRASPVAVCRALSAAINSNEDRGVAVGRWDGKYEAGVARKFLHGI